ncbi:glycosyl transferase [Desulforhopalus sp. 52FAK]
MVYQLVSGLHATEEVELCVVLLNDERLAKELKTIGVKVHVVDESKLSFIAIVSALKKLVTAFSPDIIHSHRYKENLLAWLMAMTMRNIKLFSTQHGMPELSKGDKNNIPKKIKIYLSFQVLSRFFNCTVAVSEEMRQCLIDSYGFASGGINTIYNGVCLPKSVIKNTSKRLTIGSAGRLYPVKGFELLVDIAKLLAAKTDGIDFVLAGDGPEDSMLKEKVRKAGLQDRFLFLGHIDDMDSFYKKLDIYISTSVHEGIPMSVLEAMSHGLPAVVPMVGGFPEIVQDGISGYLISKRDPEEFAARCLMLLACAEDREQIAGAARQRVIDCFSREAMVTQYYNLYRKVLN